VPYADKDPDVQPTFRMYIENIIENILATVETLLGLDDFSDFGDEKHELTIPEQLTLLAERIDNVTEPVQRESIPKPVPILTTKTEIRAHLLVEHLKNDVQERSGCKFLSSEEIVSFLKYDIDESIECMKARTSDKRKKKYWTKRLDCFLIMFFLVKNYGFRNNFLIDIRISSNVSIITKQNRDQFMCKFSRNKEKL
jgi:hypothetical protein